VRTERRNRIPVPEPPPRRGVLPALSHDEDSDLRVAGLTQAERLFVSETATWPLSMTFAEGFGSMPFVLTAVQPVSG